MKVFWFMLFIIMLVIYMFVILYLKDLVGYENLVIALLSLILVISTVKDNG